MLVDENGQPYIAHAFWNKKGQTKKNHKYIAKIGEGVKARYFYTQQELDAYKKELKAKGEQSVKTLKSDLKKRKTWKDAEKEASSSLKEVKSFTTTNKVGMPIGKLTISRGKSPTEDAYDKKFAEATKKTYDATKLGKAENAVKSVPANVKEKVSSFADNVKSKSERMVDEFKETSRKQKDKILNNVDYVKDVYGDNIPAAVEMFKDWAGVDEKERRDTARKNYSDNEEKIPGLKRQWFDAKYKADAYDDHMYEKYGSDYKEKMTPYEKDKYEKYQNDLTKKAEAGWDASVTQHYNKASRHDGDTLKDKLDKAEADYNHTLLGKIEDAKSRITGENKLREYEDIVKEYNEHPTEENGKKVEIAYRAWRKTLDGLLSDKTSIDGPSTVGYKAVLDTYHEFGEANKLAEHVARGHYVTPDGHDGAIISAPNSKINENMKAAEEIKESMKSIVEMYEDGLISQERCRDWIRLKNDRLKKMAADIQVYAEEDIIGRRKAKLR